MWGMRVRNAALGAGDPLAAVEELAKAVGSTVWPVTPHDPKSDQNALEYALMPALLECWMCPDI
jgi:hypothetical protein